MTGRRSSPGDTVSALALTAAIRAADRRAGEVDHGDDRVWTARWLPKKHSGSYNAVELAKRMLACTPDTPCGSGACNSCATAAQRRATILLRKATRRIDLGEQVGILSTMVAAAATPLRSLGRFDPSTLITPIREALIEADVSWAALAIDISVNEHATGRYAPFVLPHVHGVVVTSELQVLRKALKAACPATDAIPRPLHLVPWDGDTKAFDYMMKLRLERRIGVDNASRFDPRNGTTRLCRAVRKDRPRSRERRDLLLFFHRIGIDRRLILYGAALRRTAAGIRIVPTSRTPADNAPMGFSLKEGGPHRL